MAITYHTKDTHALRQGPKMDTLAKFTSTNGSIKNNPPEKTFGGSRNLKKSTCLDTTCIARSSTSVKK